MKRFFKGYGQISSEARQSISVSLDKPPTDFLLYRDKVFRALLAGMVIGMLIPLFASFQSLRDLLFNSPIIAFVIEKMPYFRSLCAVTKETDIFKIWHIVLYGYAMVLILFAIASYPYGTMRTMSRRIHHVRDHVLVAAISVLASGLFFGAMVNPPRRCEEGKIVLGHANLMLQAMMTSPMALSIFGSLIWAVNVLTWLSTIFMVLSLSARGLEKSRFIVLVITEGKKNK